MNISFRRSRTIRVPISRSYGHAPEPAGPESFHAPAVEELPDHYQQLLVLPEADPYEVIRHADGSAKIGKFNFISLLCIISMKLSISPRKQSFNINLFKLLMK